MMNCKKFFCGISLGLAAGSLLTLMMPPRKANCVRKKVRHTAEEIEDAMEDAMECMNEVLGN